MAIIDTALYESFNNKNQDGTYKPDELGNIPVQAQYQPTGEEQASIAMVIDSFRQGDTIMRKPRREFNDMSVLTRMAYDQMAFNIYQPNNGDSYMGDSISGWKSNAMRPIVRNKVISITAHATARLLFPKIFAYNEQSESQEDAATVMRDLIEWASDQAEYSRFTMYSAIGALVNPCSIMHLEYCQAYRTIKTEKDENGKWKTKKIVDEDNSGFKLTPVPVDELYIADFYTEDIQKQEFLIWRRVQSYAQMKSKYGTHKNFKYVKPGIQIVYNDANVAFYEVYDSNLHGSLCEEVIFYSKALDLQLALVNGVLMCDPDEPNPRLDKNYPFIKYGYELLDEGRCFYYKSLAFKMQPDADIINTLYPLIIDGTYLSVMPPIIIAGEEAVGSEVVIPGAATTLTNPDAAVTPLRVGQDIRAGMEMLQVVEESINQSTEDNINEQPDPGTAYAMSVKVQQAQMLLGPFISMISSYVRQYGNLLKSDVIQYLTIPEVNKIIDDGELIYKTLIVHDRQVEGGVKSRKIKFDAEMPQEMTEDEELAASYELLETQGGTDSQEEIYKVNPLLFKDLKYMVAVSPDVATPMSDDLEKALGLELFDRAIGLPFVDQEEVAKDFLFGLYPKAKNNVNKYFVEQEQPMTPDQMAMNPEMAGQVAPGVAQQPNTSVAANPAMGQNPKATSPLTQSGRVSPMAAMRNNPLSNKVSVK